MATVNIWGNLTLKDPYRWLINLIISKIDNSSKNLKLWTCHQGQWSQYYDLFETNIPIFPSPWGPPPFSVWVVLFVLFHLTFIFVSLKKLIRIGIRLERTSFSMKNWMPRLCDWWSKVCDQSTILTMIAKASHSLFLSTAVQLILIILIR